jgi:hypothetical protein
MRVAAYCAAARSNAQRIFATIDGENTPTRAKQLAARTPRRGA